MNKINAARSSYTGESVQDILDWITKLNSEIYVSMHKNRLEDSDFWFYDEAAGEIVNKNRSFFRITGMQRIAGGEVIEEQPIIIQDEIGYLGIICREFDGEMHYLMQAKIEPGNINKIQLSPTIQATKSNFTQKHGGKRPAYLDYFINASKYKIIVDQIQSEQSSRFFRKRNRNIIIEVDEDIEVLKSHKWMTLEQIKALMRYDNIVNMDSRTVLSCLPLYRLDSDTESLIHYARLIKDDTLFRSVLGERDSNVLPEIYQYINNYKMFDESTYRFVPLYSLDSWHTVGNEFVCKTPYSFKLVFCDIEIEGREVRHWTQPLFEATGIATFGLLTCVDNGIKKFLVHALPEIGCFDGIELAPSVQREYIHKHENNKVDDLFDEYLNKNKGIKFDTLLSEEGGRFYCEQNRNVIVDIGTPEALGKLPEGYFWADFKTLNTLVQVNNCLNIQLRNLLSVLEW